MFPHQSFDDFVDFDSKKWEKTVELLNEVGEKGESGFEVVTELIRKLQILNWGRTALNILHDLQSAQQQEFLDAFFFAKEHILAMPALFPNGFAYYYDQPIIRLTKAQCLGILSTLFFSCSTHLHTFLHANESAKFSCLLSYFHIMQSLSRSDLLSETLLIERKTLSNPFPIATWKALTSPLLDFEIDDCLKIEDFSGPSLKADFANQFIGGGVLNFGCVQEEILFSIYPELLVSIFFCRPMAQNEAIAIRGARRVADYTGYGWGFRFANPVAQTLETQSDGCIDNNFVAIDALMCEGIGFQFSDAGMARELNKAYVGFMKNSYEREQELVPIVTGKWGCGEFGGFAPLKMMIQWAAASLANRKIVITTFKDQTLAELRQVMEKFRGQPIGDLIQAVQEGQGFELFSCLLGKSQPGPHSETILEPVPKNKFAKS
jgi:hypothetical protein